MMKSPTTDKYLNHPVNKRNARDHYEEGKLPVLWSSMDPKIIGGTDPLPEL